MKTVTLKVLMPFHDIDNDGKKRIKNEVFECSDKRVKQILKHEPILVKILEIKK